MLIAGFVAHAVFKKQFRKLSAQVQKAFNDRVRIFLESPAHPLLKNHPLHGEWKGCWSINITGDIRAIYHTKGSIAIFLEIGIHGELYGS